MSRRAWLVLVTIAASATWVFTLRHSGLEPLDAPVLRGVLLYVPTLTIAVTGLVVALRTGLFTPVELGLGRPEWAAQRGRAIVVLLLLAVFLAGALVDTAGPIGAMVANGMSHDEIVAHLRRYEYRYTYGQLEPPLAAWEIGVQAAKGLLLAPLVEEVPYRALFVPVAFSRLSRQSTALASGVVFFLVHWLAYGAQPHPAYFLSGWAFAWAFTLLGLPGALAAHAGENFGVFALGTYAAFASSHGP